MEPILKVIKTEEEYEHALETLDTLMDAEPGTLGFDRLEVLAALIKHYEDVRHPIGLPTPVEAIKFYMDQLGLCQADLIPFIGSRSKVSEILGGKRPLTLGMIRVLHEHLKIPADLLLQGQDAEMAMKIDGMEWGRFPLKEMAKRKVVPGGRDILLQAEELVRGLIARAGGLESFEACNACFRQGRRLNAKGDSYALMAWILEVKAKALETMPGVKFKHSVLNHELLRKVVNFSVYSNGPKKALESLEGVGIRVVVCRHYKRTYLDGAVLMLQDGTPVIALTLRHDRLDNFWFTLLHELAHLVAGHVSLNNTNCLVDDMELEPLDEMERDADQLAIEAAIPGEVWRENKDLAILGGIRGVIALASRLDINPAIVAGRVRRETKNYKIHSRHVGFGEVRAQFGIVS